VVAIAFPALDVQGNPRTVKVHGAVSQVSNRSDQYDLMLEMGLGRN
jgi:hypothetical protein